MERVWETECKELAKNRRYKELSDELTKVIRNEKRLTQQTAKRILYYSLKGRRNDIALWAFSYLEAQYPNMCHSASISFGLEAAFRLQKYSECERIYSKYMGLVKFPIETSHILLKSFLEDYNFIVAKEFFFQLLEDATEDTLKILLVGLGKLARNPNEMEAVYEKWVNLKGKTSASIYAVMLDLFINFRLLDKFEFYLERVMRCEIDSDIGIMNVLIKYSLCLKDDSLTSDYEAKCEVAGCLPNWPYLEAIKFFIINKDMAGISYVVSKMKNKAIELDSITALNIGRFMEQEGKLEDISSFVGELILH